MVLKKQRWHFGLRKTASRATTFLSPFYFLFLVLDVVLLIASVIVSIIFRNRDRIAREPAAAVGRGQELLEQCAWESGQQGWRV
jgi:hypothetical protein